MHLISVFYNNVAIRSICTSSVVTDKQVHLPHFQPSSWFKAAMSRSVMKRPTSLGSQYFTDDNNKTSTSKKQKMDTPEASVGIYVEAASGPLPGFGIYEYALACQHNIMTKHAMRLALHMNSRVPLHNSILSPLRRWRYLTFFVLDFLNFVNFEYVTRELQKIRMKIFSLRGGVLAELCAP